MNSERETLCLERMKGIIATYGDESEIKTFSGDQIHEAYKKIADGQIRVPGSGSRKIKSLLFNLDNLRPDFKSRAEPILFEIWYESFKKFNKGSMLSENLEVQADTIAVEVEIEEKVIDEIKDEQAEVSEDRPDAMGDYETVEKPVEKPEIQSPTMPVFFKKRKEDLFDKFLSIMARFMARFVR